MSGHMEMEEQEPSSVEAKPPVSCLSCSRRKVKCDKQHPCMNCKRRHTECVYATSRKKRVRGPGKTRTGERLEDMTSRVAYLEGLIEKLQSHVSIKEPSSSTTTGKSRAAAESESNDEDSHGGDSSDNHSTFESDSNADQSKPSLLVHGDKNLYIGNGFWASMNNKFGDKEDLAPRESYPTPNSSLSTDQDTSGNVSSQLLFGASCGTLNHEMLRPPRFLISTYWQFYVTNFDPIYKILHKPHMESIIKTAADGSQPISPSNEALLFAIYLAVVTSLTPDEVKRNFFDDRISLVTRYRRALESSLAQAGLLNTSELATVQALVIYIICLRRYADSRTIWSLVGLASRIALGMGMQHDGSKFDISPWMIEMRRRLWWHIYLLDMRAAEDQGCEMIITSDLFDAQLPLNINDEDLDVNATVLPPNRIGMTEMSMGLMRLETTETGLAIGTIDRGISSRWQPKQLTLQERLDAIKVCERNLHQKYLRHCRQDDPLSILNFTLAKLNIAKMTLTVYHLNSSSSSPSKFCLSRDELFMMSISVIENAQILESLPIFRPWSWACRKYMHWYAVAYILMELCSPSRSGGKLVDRAWKAIDGLSFFTNDILQPDHSHEAIYRPIRRLLERARQLRVDAQMTQLQYESRLAEFEQWNLRQFQELRPDSENFDWFLQSENPAGMSGVESTLPLSGSAPPAMAAPDLDFQDNMNMTGLFQVDPQEIYGTVFGGGVNGWLYT